LLQQPSEEEVFWLNPEQEHQVHIHMCTLTPGLHLEDGNTLKVFTAIVHEVRVRAHANIHAYYIKTNVQPQEPRLHPHFPFFHVLYHIGLYSEKRRIHMYWLEIHDSSTL
jgi:hypothetical protein